uniref:Uncharacterized protein n=1 Tax=viral metagenome TaxID=1070528 RepID=A0A6C0BNF5_9ZZZZ
MSCIQGIQGSRGPSGPTGTAGINPLDTQIISDGVHYVSIADTTPQNIVGSMKYEFSQLQPGTNTVWTGDYPALQGLLNYGIGYVIIRDTTNTVSNSTLKRVRMFITRSLTSIDEFILIHVDIRLTTLQQTAWLRSFYTTTYDGAVYATEIFKSFTYTPDAAQSMIVANSTSEIIGSGFYADNNAVFSTSSLVPELRCINISIYNDTYNTLLDNGYAFDVLIMTRAVIPQFLTLSNPWRFVDLVLPRSQQQPLTYNSLDLNFQFKTVGDILKPTVGVVFTFPSDSSTLFVNPGVAQVTIPNWSNSPSREIFIMNGTNGTITIIHDGGQIIENGITVPSVTLLTNRTIALQFDGDQGFLYVSSRYT